MAVQTTRELCYTRIVEHKHFEYSNSPVTWITHEYSTPYKADRTEPFYPVNDAGNNRLYARYKALADALPNVVFGGRLAEYKYYDMHDVIKCALDRVADICSSA
jgi:UDP-galactopyranose mutase